jgi:hypothetical protein
MAEEMDRAERLDRDIILCGPGVHNLTQEERDTVVAFQQWLRGDRNVWDDEGNDVVNQGEQ